MSWRKPNLDTFFALASPTTLANLIADAKYSDAAPERAELERMAREALVANVGEQEAEDLINAACNAPAIL